MDINPRLYVEIHPYEGPHQPHPHPVRECYFVLSNTQRQIWFIPQRHLLAYRLIDSDEFSLPMDPPPAATANGNGNANGNLNGNVNGHGHRLEAASR